MTEMMEERLVDEPTRDEEAAVFAWRELQFRGLGFTAEYAAALACCSDVDYHDVARLVRLGASVELAARILR